MADGGDGGDGGGDDARTPDDASPPADDGAPPVEAPDAWRARLESIGPNVGRFIGVAATRTSLFAATATGLRRSRDAGETWTLLTAPEVVDVAAMATLGPEVFVVANRGVYRSTDDGETWTRTLDGEQARYHSYLSARGPDLFVLADGRPHRWNASAARWDALPPPPDLPFDVLESDGTALFANRASRGGVYRLDLGAADARWTPVEGLGSWGYQAFAFGDGVGYTAHPGTAFRRAGGTWTAIDAPVRAATDFLVAGDSIYAVTPEGLHASADRGTTWNRVVTAGFWSGFALASDGANVYAASENLWRGSGTDGAWSVVNLPADQVRAIGANDAMVVSLSATGLRRWDESRSRWEAVGGFETIYHEWLSEARVTVHEGEVFVAASGAVYASDDGGRTFAARSVAGRGMVRILASTSWGLLAGVVGPNAMILRLSTDGGRTWADVSGRPMPRQFHDHMTEAQGVLFLTDPYRGIYRSVDRGQTWQAIALGDLLDVRHVVEARGALFAASTAGGVVRSTDRGATWQRVGLGSLPVGALVVRDGVLFAGVGATGNAAGGVYHSTDGGATWAPLDEGFTARVAALAFRGDTLFVGTLDHSTWSGRVERVARP